MSCNPNQPDKDVYVDGVYIGTSDENASIGAVGQKHLNHIIDSLREKSHADMVAEMLSPAPVQAQPIGDFRLAQWDEFSTNIQQVGRNPKEWSLPIKFNEQRNDFRYALRPGEDKYTSPFYVMSILANLWESLLPDEQGMRYLHNFLAAVRTHIETYTIPRYSTGDPQSDPLSKFTLADIDTQLTKYVTRYGRMERGDERVLDIMKMAHYYQVGWSLWSCKPANEIVPEPENTYTPQDAITLLARITQIINNSLPQTSCVEKSFNVLNYRLKTLESASAEQRSACEDVDKSLNILWTRIRNLEGSAVDHYTSHPDIESRLKVLEERIQQLETYVHLYQVTAERAESRIQEHANQIQGMQREFAARIHNLESRPWLTKEQEMFVRLHTPMDI